MGIMMAYTPQLVPVKKEMKAQTAKVMASRVAGVIQLSVTLMTKLAVPSVLGDGVDAVGQRQDQHSADHGLDALGGHLDHLTDVEGLLDQQHDGLIGNGQHEGLQRLGGAHNDVGADGGADDNDGGNQEVQHDVGLETLLGLDVVSSLDSMGVDPSAMTLPVVRARSSAFFMGP